MFACPAAVDANPVFTYGQDAAGTLFLPGAPGESASAIECDVIECAEEFEFGDLDLLDALELQTKLTGDFACQLSVEERRVDTVKVDIESRVKLWCPGQCATGT